MPVFSRILSIFILLLAAAPALAEGIPHNWQLGFQPAGSPVKEKIDHFHDILLVLITAITLFVLGILTYICIRFREKANPTPSKTTHNTTLEIIWTVIPVLILVAISIPSIRLLYYMDKVEKPEMTLKVIGYQWYWGYVYPDNGDIAFESYMVKDEDLKPGQLRLLEVDNEVVLPVETNVRVLITAADVIHAWAVPSLGVKKDAVPGRLNETWLKINKPGIYYGQCSELCGQLHGFMPVKIRAVTKEEFAAWVKSKGGSMPSVPMQGTDAPPAVVHDAQPATDDVKPGEASSRPPLRDAKEVPAPKTPENAPETRGINTHNESQE